jgi:hypothetical protein
MAAGWTLKIFDDEALFALVRRQNEWARVRFR